MPCETCAQPSNIDAQCFQVTALTLSPRRWLELEINFNVLVVLKRHPSQSTTLIMFSFSGHEQKIMPCHSLSRMSLLHDPLQIKRRFCAPLPKCQSLSGHSSLPDHRTDSCFVHSYKSPLRPCLLYQSDPLQVWYLFLSLP